MVTDIFPALALGLGTGDLTVMLRPPRDPAEPMVTGRDWVRMALYSASITAAVIIAVAYSKTVLHSDDLTCNHIAFITLTFAQLFHVFNMSSPGSGFLTNEITRNKWVWMAVMICSGLILLVFAVPGLRLVLGLSVIPLNLWLVAVSVSLLPLIIFQFYKIFQKKESLPTA